MKQLNFVGDRTFEWFDVPEPIVTSPDQVIARPIVMGRCDADFTMLMPGLSAAISAGPHQQFLDPMVTRMLGAQPNTPPIPVGHESVCEIVDTGADVKQFVIGDRVIVPWAVSCGHCGNCSRKLTSHCENAGDTYLAGYGFGNALGPWGGMVSDYVHVPFADRMLTRLPTTADARRYASASDNLADAWRTVGPALAQNPDQGVCVVGGGAKSIGLYVAGIAVALGSPNVTYLDSDRKRLDIAEKYGAKAVKTPKSLNAYLPGERELGDFTIGVEASAKVSGFNFLFDHINVGGTVHGIAFYFFNEETINYFTMYGKSLTLKLAISHPAADMADVVDFLTKTDFDPTLAQTNVHHFSEADRVYGKAGTKLVILRD